MLADLALELAEVVHRGAHVWPLRDLALDPLLEAAHVHVRAGPFAAARHDEAVARRLLVVADLADAIELAVAGAVDVTLLFVEEQDLAERVGLGVIPVLVHQEFYAAQLDHVPDVQRVPHLLGPSLLQGSHHQVGRQSLALRGFELCGLHLEDQLPLMLLHEQVKEVLRVQLLNAPFAQGFEFNTALGP